MSVPTVPRPRRRWFGDRPIGVEIAAVLALLALVVAATTVLAGSRIGGLTDATERVTTENVHALEDLAAVQGAFQGDRARYHQYPLAHVATRAALRTELVARRDEPEAQLDAHAAGTAGAGTFDTFPWRGEYSTSTVQAATGVLHTERNEVLQ